MPSAVCSYVSTGMQGHARRDRAPTCNRLNLAEGRFYAPLVSRSPGINACALAPAHGLFAAAGEEGLLECFDLRQRSCAGRIDAAEACGTVRARAVRS